MKTIVCFGDSNTCGADPDTKSRFPWGKRWTSLLQIGLGYEEFQIIEEGLGSRNTVFPDPYVPIARGTYSLGLVMNTHKPFDMMIVGLGTNDCKASLCIEPEMVIEGYRTCLETIRKDSIESNWKMPTIVILAPPALGDIKQCKCPLYTELSKKRIEKLIPLLKDFAEKNKYLYFPISEVATPGIDQIHLDATGHKAVADGLLSLITQYYGKETE
jgi:lysophospholipase L1-like esterase